MLVLGPAGFFMFILLGRSLQSFTRSLVQAKMYHSFLTVGTNTKSSALPGRSCGCLWSRCTVCCTVIWHWCSRQRLRCCSRPSTQCCNTQGLAHSSRDCSPSADVSCSVWPSLRNIIEAVSAHYSSVSSV